MIDVAQAREADTATPRNDWLPADIRAAGADRHIAAGQALFHRGERITGLYQVIHGRFRLVRHGRDGCEIVLYVATAGETLAEASLFSPKYHCDAIAITDATVRLYPKAAVLAELQRSPATAKKYMAMLAKQVVELRMRLEQRNIRSAHDRVRHYLAINVEPDGHTVRLRGTVKELAAELGLTHEAVYRVLSELAATGEIERPEGRIIRLKNSPLV
jgi:CRP/FNR family transcriptional regulator, dissimilatory nitrate respiration regulator